MSDGEGAPRHERGDYTTSATNIGKGRPTGARHVAIEDIGEPHTLIEHITWVSSDGEGSERHRIACDCGWMYEGYFARWRAALEKHIEQSRRAGKTQ